MRISHNKNKFIFLANPKTASSSIRNILTPLSDVISKDYFPYYHHTSAFELREHFKTIGLDWESYFSFNFVRNPWDRAISNYFYAKPDKDFYPWYHKKYNNKTAFYFNFEDWLEFVLINSPYDYSNYNVKSNNENTQIPLILNTYSLLIPLKWFSADLDGNRIVSKVFKLENIENNLIQELNKKGIRVNKIPKINIGKYPKSTILFSKKSHNLIENFFWEEIEEFEYSFRKKKNFTVS